MGMRKLKAGRIGVRNLKAEMGKSVLREHMEAVRASDDGSALTISSGNGKGKVYLLTRDLLDGRSVAARQFDSIARGVAADMGGEDQLSTVQKHLVEAFAGVALQVNDCNAWLILGERVDMVEHGAAVITLVRIASRLGVKRLARDISAVPPTAEDYFRFKAEAAKASA
jgi:hypothetical protein